MERDGEPRGPPRTAAITAAPATAFAKPTAAVPKRRTATRKVCRTKGKLRKTACQTSRRSAAAFANEACRPAVSPTGLMGTTAGGLRTTRPLACACRVAPATTAAAGFCTGYTAAASLARTFARIAGRPATAAKRHAAARHNPYLDLAGQSVSTGGSAFVYTSRATATASRSSEQRRTDSAVSGAGTSTTTKAGCPTSATPNAETKIAKAAR